MRNDPISADAPSGGPAALRDHNRRRVLAEVRRVPDASRAAIAQATGLSQPTVSAVVAELIERGVVFESGRRRTATGRPGTLLRFNARHGHVLGFDIGGSRLRAVLADLAGEHLGEHEEPTTHEPGDAIAEQILRVAERLLAGRDRPLAAALGVPGAVDPVTGRVSLAVNVQGLAGADLRARLRDALGAPVAVENDVNMAALGELWDGAAQGTRAFALVAIGTGIGLGIVLDGELWRGHHGAAGEIAYLPVPAALALDQAPEGARAAAAGAQGLRRLVAQALDEVAAPSPLRDGAYDARDVFALARDGDAVARRAADCHAGHVTHALAAVCALLDPELLVLAGGLGASPYLLDAVRRELPRYVPIPPDVVLSALRDRAQLHGAVAVARRLGLDRLDTLLSTRATRG
jgi:predicted NBD/HSP70 family sugar kinase